MAKTGSSLAEAFLPIKTSDALVMQYRRWLDVAGRGMPFFEGLKGNANVASRRTQGPAAHETGGAHRDKTSRYYRHVLLSKCTRDALRNVLAVQKAATGVIIGSALAAIAARFVSALAPHLGSVVAIAATAVLAKLAAQRVERLFYKNFERVPAI